ncbi:hypothetical protein DV736_g5439, partial [Chaetothyriales sp. CBS 134916]
MFTRSMLADVSVFENHVQRLISRIPHNGDTVDLQPLFFHLSLDISSHVMLGESTDLQLDKPGTTRSILLYDLVSQEVPQQQIRSENMRITTGHTTIPIRGGPNGQSPVFVPRGSLVIWYVYCLQRRDALWERPDDFIPERWLARSRRQEKVCIGQQSALLLVSYVTVRMLQGIREGGLESRDPDG